MRTRRLQVRLRDVEPVVERTVDVPATATLPELHLLLQAAMGWVDVHLHQFEAAGGRFGPDDDEGFDDHLLDESEYRLRDLGNRWVYRYDFGDGWEHDVEVVGAGAGAPGCVDGRGACPLEDCGGPPGWDRLQEVLADPAHPEHDDARTWCGGALPVFDREEADLAVRQAVGAVPGSVRLLLDAIGDGVRLTKGGRLPRPVLHAVQEHRPHWSLSGKPAGLEEDVLPLLVLHEGLRGVGVLRVRNGVVSRTKAAADDLEVVRRLRRGFGPDEGFEARLAGVVAAVLVTEGPLRLDDLAARAFPLLGRGWAINGRPLEVEDVKRDISRRHHELDGLDQLVVDGPEWRAGPSALWLSPLAAGLVRARSPESPQPHYR